MKSLTLLIALLGSASSAPSVPLSMQGQGQNSMGLWLNRTLYGQGKLKSNGHFYHSLTVGKESFPMQVSSWESLTSVVGTQCRAPCDVDHKAATNKTSDIGPMVTRPFISFNPDPLYNSSWAMDEFKGQLNAAYTVLEGKRDFFGNLVPAEKVLTGLDIFVIEEPMSSLNPMYSSDESGTLGFGPWSQENGNIADTAQRSLMQQGVNTKLFANNIVSYNITFKGEHSHHHVPTDASYVQLDTVNTAVTQRTSWVDANSWNDWSINIQSAQLTFGAIPFPVLEFEATAIFDPAVDYLYVSQIEFDEFFVGALQAIYNGGGIQDEFLVCTDEKCFFNITCDAVVRMNTTFSIAVGPTKTQQVEVDINIEDYMYPGKSPFDGTSDACFLPIFVSDPRDQIDVFRTWFLGNMFLDKYFIINDMSQAGIPYSKDMPKIGIYDKTTNSALVEEVKETAFLQ